MFPYEDGTKQASKVLATVDFVTWLGTDPDSQGKGVGSALVKHTIDHAQSLGLGLILPVKADEVMKDEVTGEEKRLASASVLIKFG
jgi:GNAT superfamily N-acetyltransferase